MSRQSLQVGDRVRLTAAAIQDASDVGVRMAGSVGTVCETRTTPGGRTFVLVDYGSLRIWDHEARLESVGGGEHAPLIGRR